MNRWKRQRDNKDWDSNSTNIAHSLNLFQGLQRKSSIMASPRDLRRSVQLGCEMLEDRVVPTASPNALYVNQLYIDLLHRPAEPGAQTFWSGLMSTGVSSKQIALDIMMSVEFRDDMVQHLYKKELHRSADPTGLADWSAALQTQSIEQVEAGILGSPEFFQDAGGTTEGFLTSLYKHVFHRGLDATGASTFGQELASGMSRVTVAFQLLNSTEYRTDWVGTCYERFLHRSPDAPGLNSWVSQGLDMGMTDQAVIAGFVSAPEFFAQKPSSPTVTSPSSATTTSAKSFAITGTAQSGSLVQVLSSGSVVGSEQLVGTATDFSITVPLKTGSANNFTVTAANALGNKSAPVTVPTITQDSGAIKVTVPATQLNLNGDNISGVPVTATGTGSTPITFTAKNLPPGLTIDSTTGVISGTIATTGSNNSPYNVTVTAHQGTDSHSTSFSWVVTPSSSASLPFSLTNPAWVTLPSGVRIQDLTVGTGTAVKKGDSINVAYAGFLTDGTNFQSNNNFPATLGTSLIAGWVDGIPGMKPGGVRLLDIPSSLAYGTKPPAGSGIPNNAELVFKITLNS
jgi:hypothetical protein